MNEKTALIAGSSGLVGNELLHLLLEGKEYDKVYAVVRKPLFLNHPKLTEVVIDFDQLENYQDYFAVDDVFSCLGTTIKKAKTKEAMYRVDVEYPLDIAELAYKKGAKQFLLVSSMNANPNSSLFYPKIKGELEQEVAKLPFETVSLLRPSLLMGVRQEFRFGEKIAGIILSGISFLFVGPLRKSKAIRGETVALAMYRIAQQGNKGITIYLSDQLESIGN
ncbi:oxidoreductase [Bacillus sp. 1NLA3E]|uniref:oxidoreductase n=1 Tax=Bacillus sp. 1NLA3E TaxID=666686 RepID=UPI000247F472|nr:oxidoreductase [Bacillus sp. 1NLA3E]